jgi:hypothetical protein
VDALPWEPRIHPFLFFHRVKGLPMGLYALPRTEQAEQRLRLATRDEFIWEPVDGCPESLPLRLLLPLDLRKYVQGIACDQEIAAHGAVTVVLLADWQASIELGGFWYRRLFWEAGLLGQALYLEAEAAGVRATGIGCFLDDELHRLLGLGDQTFQALYLQAIGGPVLDGRLTGGPG